MIPIDIYQNILDDLQVLHNDVIPGNKHNAKYLSDAADFLIKLNYKCKTGDKNPDTNECQDTKSKHGYDEVNKLAKQLRKNEISVDEFTSILSKFPQTLMFRQTVRDYGVAATGLGAWFSDTIFDERRDKEFTGRNIVHPPKDIDKDDPPERPDSRMRKEINKSSDIISVKEKPYSRIRLDTNSDIVHQKVNYITKQLYSNNIHIGLLDISPMISLLGAQGMTLASIKGENKENLRLNIDGLMLSHEIFNNYYYKKAVDNARTHIEKYKKLPVLSSSAKSLNEFSKMIIDHEIGHMLLYKHRYEKMKSGDLEISSRNIQIDPEWAELAKNAWANGFKSTTHGDSSTEELFAEAYCALENNKESMFPKELMNFVKTVKSERF